MTRAFLAAWFVFSVGVFPLRAQQETSPPPASVQQPGEPPKPHPKHPMTEERRVQLEQRLNAEWNKMSTESKQHLMHLHHSLSEMPPDQRKFIHDRIERFVNMSPAEREKLQQNRQKWEQMTPEERQKARDEFRKRRQEIEEKWRRDHPGEDGTSGSNHGPKPPAPSDSAPPSPSQPTTP